MKHELRRVEPLRAANVCALVYGLLTAAIAVIFLPFFLLLAMFGAQDRSGGAASVIPLFLLIFYPIMGLIFGWIGGLISAAAYNLIVRWTGGLLIETSGPTIPTPMESGMV